MSIGPFNDQWACQPTIVTNQTLTYDISISCSGGKGADRWMEGESVALSLPGEQRFSKPHFFCSPFHYFKSYLLVCTPMNGHVDCFQTLDLKRHIYIFTHFSKYKLRSGILYLKYKCLHESANQEQIPHYSNIYHYMLIQNTCLG